MKKIKILLLIVVFISFTWLGVAAHANQPLSISKKAATMELNSKLTLTIGNISGQDITWASTTPTVATVSKWGTVQANSTGDTIIVAAYQNQTFTCFVKVVDSTINSSIIPTIIETLPKDMAELDLSLGFEYNLLQHTKSFVTIGIDKPYIDVNDVDYIDGATPALAILTSSNHKNLYITKTSCPEKGIVRFHFNTTVSKSTTVVINYSKQETPAETSSKEIDLAIFMGQSNASGVGTASYAPIVDSHKGSEFRAISDPTTLYNITEPFGVNENKELGINDRNLKTGSMISAFVNSYYEQTNRKLICISASQGATSISMWQPGENRLKDAIQRYQTAITWLEQNGYTIKNKFVVWCQGETDGGLGLSSDFYSKQLKNTIDTMLENGADNFYIIRIGNNRDNNMLYESIITAQTEICKTYRNTVLASTKFSSMATNGMMKDQFHYTQYGYNITGYDAGMNVGYHIVTGESPTMYDYQTKSIYKAYTK